VTTLLCFVCTVLGKGRREDITCSDIAHNDKLGLEAICAVHRQLDDDANGDVDPVESAEVSLLVALLSIDCLVVPSSRFLAYII